MPIHNAFITILLLTTVYSSLAKSVIPDIKSFDDFKIEDYEFFDKSKASFGAMRGSTTMCSAAMGNMTRLAKFAGALLIEDYDTRRNSRAAVAADIIRQHPGRFCRSIWRRLQRVNADLIAIETILKNSHGSDRIIILQQTVDQLRESLQEQMNIHNVPFKESQFHAKKVPRTRSAGERSHIKNRAEVGLDHIVTRLENVNIGCARWRRSLSKKKLE